MPNARTVVTLRSLTLTAFLTLALPSEPAHALASLQDPAPPAANLTFTPEAPAPGSTVKVTYQPLDALAGEPELVLRGHFEIPRRFDPGHEPRNERVATLTPGDGGFFTGSFTAPDAAAYGTFVVEDLAGERLDANGAMHFELLVHGEDKRSHAGVLFRRAGHYRARDLSIANESEERAAELYREVLAEENPGEVVTVTFSDAPTTDVQPDLTELPPELRWTEAWTRWQEDGNSRPALEALEADWPVAEGLRTGIANSGLLLAVELRDLDAVDLWIERILREDWVDPWSDKLMIVQMISALPERRARALELARAALADLDAVDIAGYPGRPLGQTASEYADALERARAEAQAEANRLLAAV